jgi:23S rRNA (guanosine2251-2'-O)-methyltransferase
VKPPRRPERQERRPERKPERKDPHATRDFFVDGLSAVAEYARFKPDAILSVESTPQQKQAVERVLRDAKLGIRVGDMPKREPGEQEFAPVRARVRIQALEQAQLEKRLENREKDLILALDHITDPRNLGAIMRSAAFFGVKDVIAPERRQVLLTQASVATAQGGFALTELTCVVNLNRALDDLKERGYWILGADMGGEPYAKLAGKYEKVVLVLGSEDSGMAQKVRERCDVIVSIPNTGKGLESLNVSVAAGILLSALATA